MYLVNVAACLFCMCVPARLYSHVLQRQTLCIYKKKVNFKILMLVLDHNFTLSNTALCFLVSLILYTETSYADTVSVNSSFPLPVILYTILDLQQKQVQYWKYEILV